MDPVLAIKSATINTAREIGVSHIGAVAPGYTADMVLTKDIHTMWAGRRILRRKAGCRAWKTDGGNRRPRV